jgi:CheY-like chemotaxis protein
MPRTALLIEDSATIRKLVRLVLAGEGLEFVEADNATDGINAAINLEPDLILADENLEGKGALQICELLKRDYGLAYIPFVVLTGQIHAYDPSRGMLAGVDEVIPKPFEAEEFVQRVRDLLDIYRDRRPKPARGGASPPARPEAPAHAPVNAPAHAPTPAAQPSSPPARPVSTEADVPPLAGIVRDVYASLRGEAAEPEGYDDPIRAFLDVEEPLFTQSPVPSAPTHAPAPAAAPVIPIRPTPSTAASPEMFSPDPSPGGPLIPGLNFPPGEIERLVSAEIKRRLSKIRLQDLESEIKRIYREAVEGTVQRLLPQIKTDIILTVVKMLKDK